MATVTTRPTTPSRAESQRRVGHPLQRLRGTIRCYVAAEGLAIALLYLATWFWVGLLLDYGVFKVFGVDWVQLPFSHTVRAVVLVLLTLGLLAVVAVNVVLRIFREFRDAPLALVLERRFPALLGDRLITAVELADSNMAARYGYSQAMIDETVRDAAERVDRAPVNEVFNWKRLWYYAAAVLALTLGLYTLTGAVYCLVNRTTAVGEYVQGFNDVAVIWAERNILLIDTIWPRRAHLELVDFPANGLRVGRDAPPPTVRVQALLWVIADKDRHIAPEGWRALMWSDLTPELIGEAAPDNILPAGWHDQSIDWIELQLAKPEVFNRLPADHAVALRGVTEKLADRAASPGMSRKLRKLQLPDPVTLYSKGANASNEQSLQKEPDNQFTVTLTDLKESIRFTVRGDDYYTSYKQITVVPPPALTELLREDARPAYLYHRIPLGGDVADLKGKRQMVRDQFVSLTGDTSRIEVPAGTDVVLTATADKDLAVPGGVQILPPEPGKPRVDAHVEQLDPKTFRTRFATITAPIDFIFEFHDPDKVVGRRHIIIKPSEDMPPEVDVQVEVLRKTNLGYLCTPLAEVPFSGKIRDDWGLAAVDYAYTLTRMDSQATTNNRAAASAGLVPLGLGGFGQRLLALTVLGALERAPEEEDRIPKSVPLGTFAQLLRDRAREDISADKLKELLDKGPPAKQLLKDYQPDPATERFKIQPLSLLVKEENSVQPHYRLRLWVTAADTNIETGPRTADSKEKFTLLIVSENELLAEIAKEEESLHVKLEEGFSRLKDAQTKLETIVTELPKLKEDEFAPMIRRAEEIEEALAKAWDITREVRSDYGRIWKELEINHVNQKMIERVKTQVIEPLDAALTGEFVEADNSIRALKDSLGKKSTDVKPAEKAREDLARLIERLKGVLDSMAEITTINELIKKLVDIKNAEEEDYKRLAKLKQEIIDRLLEGTEKK